MFIAPFAKLFSPVFAAACNKPFFGFPHWWQYLDVNGSCEVVNFQFPNDIWSIGLAVLGMLLYLAGIAAVVSIIVAGVGYITAGGDSQKGASARRRIINSLIGLIIAMIATVTVTFIGNSLGGSAASSSSQLPNVPANATTLKDMLNLGLGIVGALAVLFMVISGLRYILAQGDPAKVSSARTQLVYSAVGLIVAGSALAIVNFILHL